MGYHLVRKSNKRVIDCEPPDNGCFSNEHNSPLRFALLRRLLRWLRRGAAAGSTGTAASQSPKTFAIRCWGGGDTVEPLRDLYFWVYRQSLGPSKARGG